MDEDLPGIYRRSTYRGRLPGGGRATLRIGEALPVALRALAEQRDWGFLTAWNPRSQPQPALVNRRAQRRLLADLRADARLSIHPALGLGDDGWREPSLWIVGIDAATLRRLGERYGQNAWLQGHGAGTVELHLR
jgi:hypothetical protein